MDRFRKNLRSCLPLLVAGLGVAGFAASALADSVPESIRIQEQAEKAYEASPVVPIERGNAHHRDVQEDERGLPGPGVDEPVPPPQTPPPSAKPDKYQ